MVTSSDSSSGSQGPPLERRRAAIPTHFAVDAYGSKLASPFCATLQRGADESPPSFIERARRECLTGLGLVLLDTPSDNELMEVGARASAERSPAPDAAMSCLLGLRATAPLALDPLADCMNNGAFRVLALGPEWWSAPSALEEAAVRALTQSGVHVSIGLDARAIGAARLLELLGDDLRVKDIDLPEESFSGMVTWESSVDLIERLLEIASGNGLTLTLDSTGELPGLLEHRPDRAEIEHVLALHLLMRTRWQFGNRLGLSTRAGIDIDNTAECVAIGWSPVEIASLSGGSDPARCAALDPLGPLIASVEKRLSSARAECIDDLYFLAWELGGDGLDMCEGNARSHACRRALEVGRGMRDAAGQQDYPQWLAETLYLSTEEYAFTAARRLRSRLIQELGRA